MGKGRYGLQYTALLEAVRAAPSVRAADISKRLDVDLDNAAGLLSRALRRGHVERIDRGKYKAAMS